MKWVTWKSAISSTMIGAAVLALGGCAPADNVRVSLYVPPSTSTVAARHGDPVSGMLSGMSGAMMLAGPPATVDGFDCLGVNVMGSGLQGNGYGGGGPGCDYQGVTSPMVPTATGGMIDFKVPSGPDRVFQMIGIATGTGCPGGTISDLMRTMPPGPPSPTASPTPPPFMMAQVGRAGPIALFKDTEVDIKNSYNAANPQQPFGGPNCGGGPSGPGPTLPLIGGFSGGTSTTVGFTDTILANSAMIPAGTWFSTPMALVQAEISSIQSPTSTVYNWHSTMSGATRVDLYFDTMGKQAQYPHVNVSATFGGGDTNMTCGSMNSATVAGMGAALSVWTGAGWGFQLSPSPSMGGTGSYMYPSSGAVSENLVGTSTYIVVSIRSLDTGSPFCSAIGIQNISVTLAP